MAIRANYGQMNESAADLATLGNHLQERLESLQLRVRQVSEQWSGEAQQAFAVQERRLEQALANLSDLEKSMGQQVGGSVANYARADSAAGNRILGQLGGGY